MNRDEPEFSPLRDESICAVLPAYNESENLREVVRELADVLEAEFGNWQIMVIDDGSTDGTAAVLDDLESQYPEVIAIRSRVNRGKSNALRIAFEAVSTDLVMLMDSDGQDDPAALPLLLAQIDGGCDLVTGRRHVRHDRFMKRNTSKLYNVATAKMTGVEGSDFNSGFKVMRRSVVDELSLYGELHRYIPVLAAWSGFQVTEVDVNHRDRLHGTSKFGRNRFWRGMLDLFTVKFLITYDRRPFHLIGGVGLAVGAVGVALLVWMLIEWITGNEVGSRPALLAGVTLFVVGVLLVSVGLLAELILHLHHERRREFQRARTLDPPAAGER
ncbi:MAG: glycosyltransferase family 2 protein [Acidimicrobiia bacterium]|nr:glycosyltransferase family 2 protein [Acidimicrobiia bacterium]